MLYLISTHLKRLGTFYLVLLFSLTLQAQDSEKNALSGFNKYCVSCHSGYGDKATLLENQQAVYSRIQWLDTLTPGVGSMPPAGPLRDELLGDPSPIAQAMLEFILPELAPPPPLVDENTAQLKMPSGFHIYRYAKVKSARSMTLGATGTVFVGTGGFSNPDNKVYALIDTNKNNKIEPEEVRIIAEGLINPNGVAYRKGDLYIAETQQIRRFKDIDTWLLNTPATSRITLDDTQVLNQKFPSGPGHAWKFIRFAPAPNDHLLYVPVGSFSNVHKQTPGFASIFRIDVRGNTPKETVALGVRNTVGFDFHPNTGDLWFTDNGRDQLGNGFPPDELNKVSQLGEHFGFPYCHGGLRPDNKNKDPEFNENKDCANFTSPVTGLAPHAAALGMRFYRGQQFPSIYKNSIFIAEHGSWNVTPGTPFAGYKVTMVSETSPGKYEYKDFVTGWLKPDGRTRWGRPVDIQNLPDGSMLISDDGLSSGNNSGSIYRVIYTGNDQAPIF